MSILQTVADKVRVRHDGASTTPRPKGEASAACLSAFRPIRSVAA
jgi:hypothetical protein